MEKNLLSKLCLVFPPISNQEADWFWAVPEIREYVSSSKLYMLGQREEVFFSELNLDKTTSRLYFSLGTSNQTARGLWVDVSKILSRQTDGAFLDAGKKHFRFWDVVNDEITDPLDWFTVDKLLMEHWRGDILIHGLQDHRAFLEFKLLYVGISKEGDSFSRLFQNGHEKRAKILSNETQVRPTARLTDEIVIFLFDLEQLHVNTFAPEDLDKIFEDPTVEKARLAADAEKAFVKMLDTKYNTIKYRTYPKGADGLYAAGLDSYAYHINEDITLHIDNEIIRGAYERFDSPTKGADLILVENDSVTLIKAKELESETTDL
ncbi:hypothetical protein HUA78_44130 [Myxococcus sp. CA033]|uniref:hypothetical protein n=1 Tax=Myxococcus sp. CA033 TaxID=2741516 RepID=UPI00157B88ED|nr:hypothetical protein [Myxococcus sp. CA033]NTX41440.1 hypothetical protein [Myxococcus sp. CA033]